MGSCNYIILNGEKKKLGCLYMAKSKTTGKIYVGKTMQKLSNRKSRHKQDAIKELAHTHFSRAIRKYGIEDFEWTILCTSTNNELLYKLERKLTQDFNLIEEGYNSVEGGKGGLSPSEETRKKQSLAHIGKATMTGRKASPETREKLRISHLGIKPSEETREKLSIAHKGIGLGKKISEEMKEKLRQANLGKKCSEETKKKLRISLKGNGLGRKLSPEQVEKMRQSHLGKPLSEEHKIKLSIAQKGKHSKPLGEKSPKHKLTTDQVIEIRKLLAENEKSLREIGRLYGVSHHAIGDIRDGKSWSGLGLLPSEEGDK